MEYVTLNNGLKMPVLGYGVYQVDPQECERCVSDAIEAGYRLIDTAQAYGNEEGVGNAVKKSGIKREDFFIVTKVWVSNAGYENAKKSIETSLTKLQTDYIDLLLIHQPFNDYYGTYRAMEEFYEKGLLKAIGVSNFYPDRFIDLSHFVKIKPMVNQMETHVFNQQKKLHEILKENKCQLMSWGPFAEGKNDFFNNPVLVSIGSKYGKTSAQTALKYLIQKNIVVIPKSIRKERMLENINIFDFTLSNEDMAAIEQLDTGNSLFFSHYDPEFVNFIVNYKASI